MNGPSHDGSGPYRIGAVSALSGLPSNTIRTWERRYQAVEPERTEAGGRLYNDADVERLIALRRLTEQGHNISELASQPTQALRALLPDDDPTGPLRLGVADVQLAARLRKHESRWRVDPILDATGMDTFKGHALIVALGDLGERPVERTRALRSRPGAAIVVVYEFATRETLEGLASAGAWTLRGPLRELKTLTRLIRLTSDRLPRGPRTPARRFDARELNRLVELSSPVGCECPQHLAGIIQSLLSFEAYSRRCEDRNAEDAELHAMLAEGTGLARQKMEALLAAVVDAEGLEAELR